MTTILPPAPPPQRGRFGGPALAVWSIALVLIVGLHYLGMLFAAINVSRGVLVFGSFLVWLVLIAITLYWIASGIRWLLRKLFWRVGRRLLLSYVLIGLLPFILMTVLLMAVGYMIAGVMSHAALRGERQASLGQMESAAVEYSTSGRRPPDAPKSLQIYDTSNQASTELPAWLRHTTFSGLALRDEQPILVASRQFGSGDDLRTVVFVQPLDAEWAKQLEEKGGMIVLTAYERDERSRRRSAATDTAAAKVKTSDRSFEELIKKNFGRRIIWGDITAPTDWETGQTKQHDRVFTLIVNPVSNLFQFYFGSSGDYVAILARVILVITVLLFLIYMMAALFAAVLIFSISRAVNRIERGTKAVERGDFSYRIAMKPHNQLGEMAQSFDRMTASIASLLQKVAEKERLQSEIAIAATIQRNLLPKEGPQLSGVSFAAHFEPTASIGGDYYDLFNIDKSRLAVAIGDVSGHGLSTGLVMAMVKAAITTLVEEGADEISLFQRLNELVYRSTERRAFMTLAFTIFDLERRRIRHTNAGHLYPYLLREGQPPRAIESPSLPLGVRPKIEPRTEDVDLCEGDTIVYLSDGIVEAQSEQGDPFGFDQLERLLAGAADPSPTVIRDAILEAVATHCGSRPADDDRTIMILRLDKLPAMFQAGQAEAEEPVAQEA
ncbi:MAG TPA: SpoIIE family protein phosphatase [Thermoanaerobaculia bacterium]|nr:SpoIIE family protein phosphatase [Thermoanaerobaculia bacterium]